MRPAWLLAIKSASERRSRWVLLVLAVALSAALISAVLVGLYSVNIGLERRVARTVGSGDLRIRAVGGVTAVAQSLVEVASQWPEVTSAVPRLQRQLILEIVRPVWEPASREQPLGAHTQRFKRINSSLTATGITPAEHDLRPLDFIEGRWPTADNEIVLDELALRQLGPRSRIIANVKAQAENKTLPDPALSLSPFADAGSVESSVAKPADTARDFGPATAANADEAVILNERFMLKLGDTISVVSRPSDANGLLSKLGDRIGIARTTTKVRELTLVGIVRQPPLGGRASAYMTLPTLQDVVKSPSTVSEIDITLKKTAVADTVVNTYKPTLPRGISLSTTEKITGQISKNLESNRIGFTVVSMFAFLGAAFIIMTAMTTAVTERQRELAVLRCIGCSRLQLIETQLVQGLLIGVVGAFLGVPLGVLFARILFWWYAKEIRVPLVVTWERLVLAFCGALLAGLLGAAFPAIMSARVSPLAALTVRSKLPSRRGILITLTCALAGLGLNILTVKFGDNATSTFWYYITLGLPGMVIGYFLLAVPAMVGITTLCAPLISKLIGLPPLLLQRTVRATPYRFGFTAGAMMAGLAVMVALWAQGRAILDDYLTKFKFPDAFVLGLNFPPEAQQKLDAMSDIIIGTNRISLVPVETSARFGVQGLNTFKSSFIGFEPERFFAITKLNFIDGDQDAAISKLKSGNHVLVAKEFQVSNGIKVGDTLKVTYEGRSHDFTVAGVVTSPGLDVISKYFQIGDEYVDQAIHTVFGARDDLRAHLMDGNEPPTQLINIAIAEKADERKALERIRMETIPYGAIQAGSGRRIINDLIGFIQRALVVSSAVAVLSMIVACFGVANLVIAGIHARQFEFGVLRAVGAHHSTLVRLVLGEALLIGLTACVVGTLLGMQAIYAGRQIDAKLFGIVLTSAPPLLPTAAAWSFVIVITLAAAIPAALALGKRSPRSLLSAVRG
ncbi:MAG: ABC transporter permease [Planctomycetes bacterium]|nr:ABC transporter permease [Planctomycetota bacterium]